MYANIYIDLYICTTATDITIPPRQTWIHGYSNDASYS